MVDKEEETTEQTEITEATELGLVERHLSSQRAIGQIKKKIPPVVRKTTEKDGRKGTPFSSSQSFSLRPAHLLILPHFRDCRGISSQAEIVFRDFRDSPFVPLFLFGQECLLLLRVFISYLSLRSDVLAST